MRLKKILLSIVVGATLVMSSLMFCGNGLSKDCKNQNSKYNSEGYVVKYEGDDLTAEGATTYQIQFDSKGGSGNMQPQSFTYGDSAALRTNAYTKTGYVFAGWTTEDYDVNGVPPTIEYGDGATITNITNVDDDVVTFYAVWLNQYYTARIYLMTTSGSYPSAPISQLIYAVTGEEVLVADEAEKLTQVISGEFELDYATDGSGTDITGADYEIQSNSTIINFYLKRKGYNLTFNPAGGEMAEVSRTLTVGQVYGELPTPTMTGHSFNGWAIDRADYTSMATSQYLGLQDEYYTIRIMPGEEYTNSYFQSGNAIYFNIAFDGVFDSVYINDEICNDYNYVISGNNISGSAIIGNTKSTDGTTDYSFIDLKFNSLNSNNVTVNYLAQEFKDKQRATETTTMANSSIVLKARWVANNHIITLNPNGGAVNSNTKGVAFGAHYGELPVPVRAGYEFQGWEYEGAVITETSIVNVDMDHTLIASWDYMEPTVTISANRNQMEYGADSVELTVTATHDLQIYYKWHRSTVSGFTPSSTTLISGAIESTYIHNPTDTNAGIYYYKCEVLVEYEDGFNTSSISEQIAITVNRTSNSFDTIINTEMVYNKIYQELAYIIDSDGVDNNVYYSTTTKLTSSNYTNTSISSTSVPTAMNAGDYIIYFYVPQTTNYLELSGHMYATIDKRENITVVKTYQNLVYDGSEKLLMEVTDYNERDNDVYYSIGTELTIDNYSTAGSTTLPKATNAGDYAIYYYIPSNANYKEFYGSATTSIAMIANDVTITTSENLVYNGEEQVLLRVTDSDGINNNIYYNIGTELNNTNYTTTSGTTTTYPTKKDAGTYVVYYYIPASTNYYEVSGVETIAIAYKQTTLTINPNGGYWAGSNTETTFTNNNGVTQVIEAPSRTGYNFKGWQITEGAIFNSATGAYTFDLINVTMTAQWQIKEVTVTISANTNIVTRGQTTATLTATCNHELEKTYQWYRSSTSGFTPSSSNIISGANGAQYIHDKTTTIAGVYYYVCEVTIDGVKAKSNEIAITVVVLENVCTLVYNQQLTYNGSAQVLLQVLDSDGVDNNIYYSVGTVLNAGNYQSYSTDLPTRTDAGTYMVYFYVPASDNYAEASGNVEVVINKTENILIIETYNNLVYNGNPQTLASATDDDGIDNNIYHSLTEKLTAGNYANTSISSTSLPTATQSGKYTIYFYVPASANYNELSGTAEVEIQVKYTTLTINPNGGKWQGNTDIVTYTKHNGQTQEIPNPTRLGCIFKGWTITEGAMFSEGVYTFDTIDVQFVANWEEKPATINITSNATTIEYSISSATFTAVAEHELEIAYQWYRDTTAGFTPSSANMINGATESQYYHSPTETKAGTYYYKCVASVDFGNKVISTTSNELTLTVSKTYNIFAVKFAEGLVYNGTEQTLLEIVDNDGIDNNIYYSTKSKVTSSNYTDTSIASTNLPTGINAGDYNVYFYIPESETYNEIDGKLVATIERAYNSIEIVKYFDLVYNGAEQTLAQIIENNNDEGGDVYYSIDTPIDASNYSSQGSTDLPRRKFSGKYTVHFYIPQTTNYYELSGFIKNEIGERITTITINPNGGMWEGSTEIVQFTDRDGGTKQIPDPIRAGYNFISWEYINTDTEQVIDKELLQEGVYTFDLDNVTFMAQWTIKPVTIEIECDSTEITYSVDRAVFTANAEHELEIEYKWYRSTEQGFTPSDENLIAGATGAQYIHTPRETNAGTYYYKCIASVTFEGATTSATSDELTLIVNQCENLFRMNVAQGLIYTGEEYTLLEIFDSDGIDNNVYYSIGTELDNSNYTNTTIASTTAPKRADAGQYHVYFYVPESVNYKHIKGHMIVEIKAIENEITVNVSEGLVYNDNGQYQQLLEVIDSDGIDNNIYYSFGVELNSENYTDTSIASTKKPTAINAGIYEIYFYIPASTNYKEVSGHETVSIAKAENTYEAIVSEGLVYSGQPQQLLEIIDINNDENGEVRYSTGIELNADNYSTASTDKPTETEARTYTVYFYVPETLNYLELKNSIDVTIEIKYTKLVVDPNGGLWAGTDSISEFIHQGHGTTIEIEDATREGFEFSGWDITEGALFDDETNIYTFDLVDVTMTAQWTGIQYAITIINDTTTTELTYTSNTTSVQEVKIEKVEKTGYTFSGWTIDVNTNRYNSIISNSENGGYIITIPPGAYGDIQITAQWTANTYEVAFNGNGATSGNMSNQTFTYDVEQALTENAYIKTGYEFMGWATSADGEATYSDKQVVSNLATNGVYELFAIWKACTYTVAFNSLGGSECEDISVTYDSEYGELPTTTKDGYTFKGWYLEQEFTNAVTEETIVSTDRDHTLYACWEVNSYKVTLDYQGGTKQFLYSEAEQVSGTFEFDNESTDTNKFNGDYAKAVTSNKLTYSVGSVAGTYKFSAYVMSKNSTTISAYVQETNEWNILKDSSNRDADINKALEANIWQYISIEFVIPANSAEVNLVFENAETTVNYYLDDIKVMRVDGYADETEFDYTVESQTVVLPYAVKAGYTFKGWNTKADGTGEMATSYAGGEFGNFEYYAIYELSRPTAITNTNKSNIVYSVDDATLSAIVNTEGVAVDSVTYQWYYDTSSNFSDIKLIDGATTSVFTHTSTLKDVGTYFYRCVVSVTKDGVTTEISNSTSVQIIVNQCENELEISMEGYTYSGQITSPQVITNTSESDVTFYYNTTGDASNGTEWVDITSTTLAVGTYYMYATTPASTNYKAGISNIVPFEVSPATIEIITMVDNGTNKQEDGYNFTLSSELDVDGIIFKIGAENVDVKFTYWLDTEDKTEVVLSKGDLHTITRTSAGKDTYNYTLTADNYITIEGIIELTISVKSTEVKWNENVYTYNGEDQSSSVKAHIVAVDNTEIECVVKFTIDEQVSEFKNAGTYIATATLTGENANNYTLTNASIEIVMNRLDVTITANDKTMIYTEDAPTYTYEANKQTPDSYEISYKVYKQTVTQTETITTDVTGTESSLPAGTYKIMATSTLDTSNYNVTYVDGVLTINAKAITNPVVTGTYIYNGSVQEVQLDGFDSSTMEIVDGNTGVNAGNYSVEIALADSHNYTWEDGTNDNIVLNWTIEKFDLSNATIAEIPEQPFTGNAVTPTPEVTTTFATLISGVDFTYDYSNNINATEEAVVTINAVENGNYTGTNSAYFTIAGSFIDVPTIKGTYVYNEQQQEVQLDGFDESIMEIVDGNIATDAGTYTVEIALKNTINYTWKLDENTVTKDNQRLTWTIAKADVELSVDTSKLNISRGQSATREVEIVLPYQGEVNLDGQNLTLSRGTGTGNATFTSSKIKDNNSTITITPTLSGSMELLIQYAGDNNHNASEIKKISIYIPTIKINLVTVDGIGGTGELQDVIAGTGNEVEINSEITFSATPNTNYGLAKYVVAGQPTYITSVKESLTETFTLDTPITITESLIGEADENGDYTITIELDFEEVVTLDVDVDKTGTGSINHNIITRYENNDIVHIYSDNKLTAFKNSTIILDVEAQYDEQNDQYYIVNEVVVGQTSTIVNQTEKSITQDINGLVDDEGNISTISIKAAKVYEADDRVISDNQTAVATVNIEVEKSYNAVTINDSRYIVENSTVYYNIVESNEEYDFLGMRVDGKVTLKDQLLATEWSYDSATNTRTWNAQAYDQKMSTAEPVMLQRWYTVGNQYNREVDVKVDSGITAKLVNTDIGYSYVLANNIFSMGSEALYAGNWQVVIDNVSVDSYSVSIKVYTGDSYTEYSKDETFVVDSTVTKIEMVISDITNQSN